MEVASGEYGDQMVRLVKAVQDRKWEELQMDADGDTKLLWQRGEEVETHQNRTSERLKENPFRTRSRIHQRMINMNPSRS